MNRTRSLVIPQKRSALPLLLGLLIGSAAMVYGVLRWQRMAPPAEESAGRALQARREAPEASGDPGAALPQDREARPAGLPEATVAAPATQQEAVAPPATTTDHEAPGALQGDGKSGEVRTTAIIKMEPLVANLDEGDQLRYLKLSLQLEVAADAEKRIQTALPRARHEALMYMSGLHLSDVQGMLGKQRVHRELQRRIADAVGGGLKRIYFDEFVVQ